MNKLMKTLNLFFIILFVFSAALQYNDPDPYVWIPIYLYAAVLCALAAKKKFYPMAYWIGIVVYGVYAAYEFFAKDGVLDWMQKHHAENIASTMKAETPWIEETREFFGLIILIVVLLMNYFYSRKKASLKTTHSS